MGKKKGKKGKAPVKPEAPDFLLDLDTVYVRTSRTQLKVQPKAEYINEPPSMNMAMGQEPLTGKQLFTIHYRKPYEPPEKSDVMIQTDRPKLVRILPAQIVARYSCLTEEGTELPILTHIPQEGKYVLDNEPQILKYNLQHLDIDDSDEEVALDVDDSEEGLNGWKM